jgi:exosortase A-associated hydrolase 1
MGDSTGSQISFEQSGPDIDGAIEAFLSSQPQLDGVVLWGLCDAASSILMHGVTNRNVCGIILLNPWVRSDATIASARLNKYYGQRLLSRSFWKKLLSGKVDISDSIKGLVSDLRKRTRPQTHDDAFGTDFGKSPNGLTGFRFKMLAGLNRFSGPILIILSGADLTAGEFVEISKAQNGWKEALEKPGVTIRFLDNADHTFSTALWRNRVEAWTREWLEAFESSAQKPSKPVVGNGTFSS